ncbi:hypothetical protein DRO03_11530 [Methanosarcinales archaeon]|nr:MAG: hypothetical protein DRO03_11530 [Methanosarcinales archaeon]
MPDITLIWDCELLFEKLFVEHGLSYQRTPSSAIGTPFLPGSKVMIVPTGFANMQYTKILRGIEVNKSFFDGFVKNGGVLVVYGALVPEYTYGWLPFTLEYREQYGAVDIEAAGRDDRGHECSCIFDGARAECDGYFTETDGDIILTGDGMPILVAKEHGDGTIVATTIHEFPTGEFLKWAVAHK